MKQQWLLKKKEVGDYKSIVCKCILTSLQNCKGVRRVNRMVNKKQIPHIQRCLYRHINVNKSELKLER